jgi:hypothetical protein
MWLLYRTHNVFFPHPEVSLIKTWQPKHTSIVAGNRKLWTCKFIWSISITLHNATRQKTDIFKTKLHKNFLILVQEHVSEKGTYIYAFSSRNTIVKALQMFSLHSCINCFSYMWFHLKQMWRHVEFRQDNSTSCQFSTNYQSTKCNFELNIYPVSPDDIFSWVCNTWPLSCQNITLTK